MPVKEPPGLTFQKFAITLALPEELHINNNVFFYIIHGYIFHYSKLILLVCGVMVGFEPTVI
jgi:hypothetical protein